MACPLSLTRDGAPITMAEAISTCAQHEEAESFSLLVHLWAHGTYVCPARLFFGIYAKAFPKMWPIATSTPGGPSLWIEITPGDATRTPPVRWLYEAVESVGRSGLYRPGVDADGILPALWARVEAAAQAEIRRAEGEIAAAKVFLRGPL